MIHSMYLCHVLFFQPISSDIMSNLRDVLVSTQRQAHLYDIGDKNLQVQANLLSFLPFANRVKTDEIPENYIADNPRGLGKTIHSMYVSLPCTTRLLTYFEFHRLLVKVAGRFPLTSQPKAHLHDIGDSLQVQANFLLSVLKFAYTVKIDQKLQKNEWHTQTEGLINITPVEKKLM